MCTFDHVGIYVPSVPCVHLIMLLFMYLLFMCTFGTCWYLCSFCSMCTFDHVGIYVPSVPCVHLDHVGIYVPTVPCVHLIMLVFM